ncbi:acetyltransferase [Halobacillus sp. A5]|uniref:acetyltransferase n=1 Tax=Halobacillus sp. A5 TaxID=2880263 RepID=UPI0020A6AC6A|nr:acetyltransferase [Halobacillus sp. A5]MCP3029198.1 acetyltransferase [Halobacillus sp. A5]
MKLILIGNGGHSRVIQDIITARGKEKLAAILDEKYSYGFIENNIYFGPVKDIEHMIDDSTKIVVAIGNNETRKRLTQKFKRRQFATLIHPAAMVSPSASIGKGTIIMAHAVVNAAAKVGEHCIINTASIVEHDSKIGDYSHICPNVTLTGQVSIGEGVDMGASSTVIPGITIDQWSVIGAGSTVIRDLPSYSRVAGSPARSIKKAVPFKFLHRTGGDAFERFKDIPLPTAHDRK